MKKDAYLDYLILESEKTTTITEEAFKFATTKQIANFTNQKITIVNHHLNNLFKEEAVIKINTKPVYYIPVSVLIKHIGKSPKKDLYDNFSELAKEVDQSILDKLIGSTRSLSEVIRQCKVALKYPTDGLPLLITGKTGTGKTFLVKQLYEYAKSEGILLKGAPLEIFNCAEYADNPELLSSKLFGHKKGSFTGAVDDKKGIIDVSDGGILFIDEVHRLSPESQEKLFYFIDEGKYKPIGENLEWSHAKVRLMFATTEDVDNYLLDTFIRRIPIVTRIPSLKMRGYQEKKEFLLYFLKEESKRMNQLIDINIGLFRFLVNYSYEGNVGEMKNIVKYLVGNAFVNDMRLKDKVEIVVSYLPDKMKAQTIHLVDLYSEERIIIKPTGQVEDPDYNHKKNLFAQMYNEMNNYNSQLMDQDISTEEYINKSFDVLEMLTENHNSKKIVDSKTQESIQQTIKHISEIMFDVHQIEMSLEVQKFISIYLENILLFENADIVMTDSIKKILEILKEKMSIPYNQTLLLSEMLYQFLPYTEGILSDFDILLFTITVTYYYNKFSIGKMQGVIICHGHATASSLAQTANQMIGERVFHGIDMNLDVSFYEISSKLKRYLSLHETRNGTVILIDIGHTEDLRLTLQDQVEGPFAMIDNVSTKLALDVGFKIINNENISELTKISSQNHFSKYSLFEPEVPKEKALIISCHTGIETSKKLKEIFTDNIPLTAGIKLVVTDFEHLVHMKTNTTFFARYRVIGCIGTDNPDITDVPFLGLDDIMSEEGITHLHRIFSEYLSLKEISDLNNGLMTVLSLENLVTMLSILNPEKTIQLITEMIELFQNKFDLLIPNNLRTALYIHISCMIERVITRTYVENNNYDLDKFISEHPYFIKVMKEGLTNFEINYHVEVDMSEIAYLYELFKINLKTFNF